MEDSKVRVLDSESEKLRKKYVALKKQLEQLYKELEEQKMGVLNNDKLADEIHV
ncbi:MAG TPA: hypothetical protein GX712_06485 [Bacteroidales bacterium]|nr:hypothetical protein [Bacteroidales bacterium]